MDKTTKTALIIIGSLFLLCACAATAVIFTGFWSLGNVVKWVDNSTTEDPQEAVRVGSGIADYEIPAGFDTRMAFILVISTWLDIRRKVKDPLFFSLNSPKTPASMSMKCCGRSVKDLVTPTTPGTGLKQRSLRSDLSPFVGRKRLSASAREHRQTELPIAPQLQSFRATAVPLW